MLCDLGPSGSVSTIRVMHYKPTASAKPWQDRVLGVAWPMTAALLCALIVSCGAAGLGTPASGSPIPGGLNTVVVTEPDNGKTLPVHVGERVEVRLSSTYWTFNGSSNPAVLRAVGPAVISPQPSGCVPGGGCGLAIADFDVIGVGSADVTASRTSCGEAMGCTGNQGSYQVTVAATS